MSDRLLAFGYVLSAKGLKAKVLRGAMNTIMHRVSFPAKTFQDVPSAVSWMLGTSGQPSALRAQERELADTVVRLSR